MRAYVQDTITFAWPQNEARAGLRCLPGIALLLAAGLVWRKMSYCAVAVAGAMAVGFGSFQRLGESRAKVMLLVVLGMSLAALTGSLASRSGAGVALVAAGWAFLYGLLTAWEPGLSWVGLQCVIVAVVAGGFETTPQQALMRAVLTLGGGLLQAGIITGIWRLFGAPAKLPADDVATPPGERAAGSLWGELRQHLSPGSPVGRYAWQLGITLLVAASLYRVLNLRNGYWVPMTVVIILKPEFQQTFARGLARIVGTLVGMAVATLLAGALRPGPATLAVLVVVFAWGCYALLKVNYALFALCITGYVVFLLALVGLPEPEVVVARALDTSLGGLLALVAYLLPSPRQKVEERQV